MDFTGYMIIKFIFLVALAFFGNLILSAITGRSLEEVRRDTEAAATWEKSRGD
jgi:hypothetical protein